MLTAGLPLQPNPGRRPPTEIGRSLVLGRGIYRYAINMYGSRAKDVTDVIAERRALPEAPITAAVMDRAVQVAGLLAKSGQHRAAKPADLVIAAAAEAAGLAVLHYDRDYDRISEVTRQSTEWIALSGSLDS